MWKLRLVDELPGRLENCSDSADWYSDDGIDFYVCDDFEGFESCTDPDFVPADIASHTVDNLTAAEACCACPSGGIDVTNVPSLLISWRLMVYGHESDGMVLPTDAETTGNSTLPPTNGNNINPTDNGNNNSASRAWTLSCENVLVVSVATYCLVFL